VSQTLAYINRLEDLQEGERSRLRRLAGMPLDAALPGFDLFTGLWWPLRQASPVAPRRETSWLVGESIARLGQCVHEITDGYGIKAERLWFSPGGRYRLTWIDSPAKQERSVVDDNADVSSLDGLVERLMRGGERESSTPTGRAGR